MALSGLNKTLDSRVALSFADRLSAFKAVKDLRNDWRVAASLLKRRDAEFDNERQVKNYVGMMARMETPELWDAVTKATSWFSYLFIHDAEVGIPKVGLLHLVPQSKMDEFCSSAMMTITKNLGRFNTIKKQLEMYKISVVNSIVLWINDFLTARVSDDHDMDKTQPSIVGTLVRLLAHSTIKDGDDQETRVAQLFMNEVKRL